MVQLVAGVVHMGSTSDSLTATKCMTRQQDNNNETKKYLQQHQQQQQGHFNKYDSTGMFSAQDAAQFQKIYFKSTNNDSQIRAELP